MSKPAARIGDMHVCPKAEPGPVPHVGGPVVTGEPTVIVGGMPAGRVGDMAVCVGPPDSIAQGSATVLIGGKPAARMGDSTSHGGKLVVGCPTILVGDGGGSTAAPGGTGSTGTTNSNSGSSSINSDSSKPAPPPGASNSKTGGLIVKDPATIHKASEAHRKPNVDGKTVIPLEGTRPPNDKPISIKRHADKGKTETITGDDGVDYTVSRDENGFPNFTIFETYIDDENIGTGSSWKHFKKCNQRMKDLLISDPSLADTMGLNEEQIEFFARENVDGEEPPDLTWHHHQDTCKMQLVHREKHKKFCHTGGMSIWGGGYG